MGICKSKDAAAIDNGLIDASLEKDKRRINNRSKLLLLGTGESGKSTIFKQTRILHDSGFSDEERLSYVQIIQSNVMNVVATLIRSCRAMKLPVSQEIEESMVIIWNHIEKDCTLTCELSKYILPLWTTGPIRELANKNRSQLPDSTNYFFEHLERISGPDYLPTDADVLRARVRTTGITQTEFSIQGVPFSMFDVGGQRNERRKWYHCFDDVHAVLFVVALSEYDQSLFEDESVNRMTEALSLFGEIANSRFFQNSAIILFLNKRDLFEEKIKFSNITSAFPDYQGPQEAWSAIRFIQNKFESVIISNHAVYTHVTCATDPSNVAFVLAAVRDAVFESRVSSSGFM